MRIDLDGAQIFFDTVGSQLAINGERMDERQSLVVLHGGPGFDHSILRPWFDRFADAYQVVYMDHRGNGRSTGTPRTWRLAQWGDDVKSLCDRLGLVKPLVYGLSFGGMVAMAYASRHPAHPSRLVLASTAARMELAATYEMMERLGGDRARKVAVRFWSDPGPEAAAEYIAVCMPLYNPIGATTAEARKRAITKFEVMFDFIRGEQRTMDMTADLAAIACPTLVLGGGLDPITPTICSRRIFEALPAGLGELEMFEAAGHGVHRDEPDRAEASLRRFLEGGGQER
ncbi:MAG TPA: alpha/beta hydrolase [Caulobacteraceae bacterium]